ncbi:FISUMP domain-containing protein [Elizabethkingia sp. YR214]|uniref:FISUMP domain-containing protein n=1 Tax=Elizabethkingia sp. YR214 TaxID=2135667 RepID=UPI0021007A19|nr:FISUMP domain-containing protein [Elizabethkingia sp. YR214]
MEKRKTQFILKRTGFGITISASLLLILFAIFSCRSSDADNKVTAGGTANVKINIEGEAFDDIADLGGQASLSKNISQAAPLVQRKEIPFNNDFTLVAELSPVKTSVSNQAQASLSGNLMAATGPTPLGAGIRYKVVVFRSTGEYVTERNYIRGQENSTADLNLDGGSSYTFIVYSVKSQTNLPDVTYTNTSNKTLATASISGLANTVDFMYYRKDTSVSGDQTNYLNVVLLHKLSLITTTIDASATGYNITAVTANIDSHYPSYNVPLSSGTPAQTGTAGTAAVTFPTLGTQIIVANPVMLNGNTTTGKFTLSTITIGPLTQTVSSAALTGLKITPGIMYNLKFTLSPADVYLDNYNGQKAARINGKVWMRYNLGADNSINPDQDPIVSGLHGGYYQFGRSASVANGTEISLNSNFNGNPAAANAWNSGTEAAPVKTANDPCPQNYRIPTQTEFQGLLDATVQSNVGTWSTSDTNYSAAKVLTSKKNNNVKIVLPAQGAFGARGNGAPYTWFWTNQRGSRVSYWTSTSNSSNNTSYFEGSSTSATVFVQTDGNPSTKVLSKTIRCIAQ